MKIKGIIDTDFINYKKICMTVMMPYCKGFKCGADLCQNSELAAAPIHEIDILELIIFYCNNPLTEAICFQGLEPFDSAQDLFNFIKAFRTNDYTDDIIIYTGYTKEELEEKGYLTILKNFGKINIIIKFGRYIPNQTPHFDKILGVKLISDNQYAERIC